MSRSSINPPPSVGGPVDVSVIVPVVERVDDLKALFRDHAAVLNEMARSFEFIFVLDGAFRSQLESLRRLKAEHPEVRIVVLGRAFGEAVALKAGFSQARGAVIVTLASYAQVDSRGVQALLAGIDEGYDLVVARRDPRVDSWFNRTQARVFHGIVTLLTGSKFRDLTCGSRALRPEVFDELNLYGDLHRFIPILGKQAGFRVKEVAVPQRRENAETRIFGLTVYLGRLLDILTLFFLIRFTRKPLRFFGAIGAAAFAIGFGISGYLALYRLLGFGGIANRPLLLLGILLMVFGVQSVSIGLVGEIVIFTHAREREYRIERIL